MKITNIDMDKHLSFLNSISSKVTGKLAYAIARNIRKITSELIEYNEIRNNLIEKYGEVNDNGRYTISVGTEAFNKFVNDIGEYTLIEHEVDICEVDEETICNSSLTAEEMLQLDFMIKDSE